jgi:flagellin
MTLGVLNNLSAIYAENNLNNTNNSLQTVLQQLSSGSKINSGADDAAGLSLVNGLQANSTALVQSETNATEGVGLLDVADGALSQVTNLLNRAITLATEASNGTLNSSQEAAANQEYTTILSEINNIGSTTTYNQEQVFSGNTTSIYTGDSSTAGSSIDDLFIRTLSESSVGDSGGQMTYSNGQNNVFLNLSTATQNAQPTDTLNASGATTINVNYLVKGADGTSSTATTSISVGTGTSYANTANGLIAAINQAGLGLSATFTTQVASGVSGGGNETGIQIAGGLVSVGEDPSGSSTSGVVNLTGTPASELLTQGQSITLQSGTAQAVTIAVTSNIDSLSTLASQINTQDSAVTATVLTTGNGDQSLSIAENDPDAGALSVSMYTLPSVPTGMTFTSGSSGATGGFATSTLGFGSAITSTSSELLSGDIALSNNGTPGASPITFVMGSQPASGEGVGNSSDNGNSFTVNGNSLGDLAAAVAAELGVSTSISSNGLTMTSTASGTTLEQVGVASLTATPSVGQTANVVGVTASNGTDGSTTISMNGNGGAFVGSDALTGTVVLNNGAGGTLQTFVMGSASTATNSAGPVYNTGAETVNGLVAEINNQTGTNHMSALLNASGQIVLSSTLVGTTITMGSSSLVQSSNAIAGTVTPYTPEPATASLGASFTIGGAGATSAATDTITGNIVIDPHNANIGGSSTPVTFTMGGVAVSTTTGTGSNQVVVAGNSLANLDAAINGDSAFTGITATPGAGVTSGVVTLATTAVGGEIGVTDTLTDNDTFATAFNTPAKTGAITLSSAGAATPGNALTGSVVITDGVGTPVTFVMGNAGGTVGHTVNLVGTTLTALAAGIQAQAGGLLAAGTTANASATGISIAGDTGISSITSSLEGVVTDTNASGSSGAAGAGGPAAATKSSVSFSNATDGALDQMTGSIVLSNSNAGSVDPFTFVMGNGTDSAVPTSGGTFYTGNQAAGNTLTGLMQAIQSVDAGGDLDVSVATNAGTLTVTSASGSANSNLTLGSDTLIDTGNLLMGTLSNANQTVTYADGGANSASTPVAGTIVLKNGADTQVSFIVGSGINDATHWYTGSTAADETVQGLANAINMAANPAQADDPTWAADYHFTASAGATGLVVNSSNASALTMVSDTVTNQLNSMTGVVNVSQPSPAAASTLAGLDTSAIAINGSQITATGDTLSGSIVITSTAANTNAGVTDTFVMGNGTDLFTANADATNTIYTGGTTLSSLISAITTAGTTDMNALGGGLTNELDMTAAVNTNGSGLLLTDNTKGGSITVTSTGLTDSSQMSFTTPPGGTNDTSQNLSGVIDLTDGGKLTGSGQTLTGSVLVANGGVTDTFVMGQASASNHYAAGGGTFNLTGTSIAALTQAINTEGSDTSNGSEADLALTASVDAQTGGVFIQATNQGATGLGVTTGNPLAGGLDMTLAETAAEGTNGAAGSTDFPATVQYSNGGINAPTDPIAGSIVLMNVNASDTVTYGLANAPITFVVGSGTDTNTTYFTGNGAGEETLGGLAAAIDLANTNLGTKLTANADGNSGLLVTSTDKTSVITVGSSTLVDQYGPVVSTTAPGASAAGPTYATAAVGTSGQIGLTDTLSGSIVLSDGGSQQTFTVGTTYANNLAGTITTGGTSLTDLASAINNDAVNLGLDASVTNGVLNLQSIAAATSITVGSGTNDTLTDTVASVAPITSTGAPGVKSSATVNLAAGGLATAASSDTLSGSLTVTGSGGTEVFTMGGTSSAGTIAIQSGVGGETLDALRTAINDSNIGVTAYLTSTGLLINSSLDSSIAITGSDSLKDTTPTAALSYTAATAYSLGIYNSTGLNSVYDSSSGQRTTTSNANMTANANGSSGVATIGYSDGAGVSLTSSNLLNQADAQVAVVELNQAVTDVAAMDGYIGAQINTLQSVSQVLTTQQENVLSAQNAIQATDYASATANMSKYEILSQTGIAALAQANSVQQEVTKLLQ